MQIRSIPWHSLLRGGAYIGSRIRMREIAEKVPYVCSKCLARSCMRASSSRTVISCVKPSWAPSLHVYAQGLSSPAPVAKRTPNPETHLWRPKLSALGSNRPNRQISIRGAIGILRSPLPLCINHVRRWKTETPRIRKFGRRE